MNLLCFSDDYFSYFWGPGNNVHPKPKTYIDLSTETLNSKPTDATMLMRDRRRACRYCYGDF